MKEEKKNVKNERNFNCRANAETHTCLWQGDQVRIVLSPDKAQGKEWYSCYRLRVEVRDVSWFQGFPEYGNWQPVIMRSPTGLGFLEELKKAVSVLTARELPKHGDECLEIGGKSPRGSNSYQYVYDKEELSDFFHLSCRAIDFENGKTFYSYSLTIGYKLLTDLDVEGFVSDTVSVSIKEITKEDLRELALCLDIFLAHKEELRLINTTYLDKDDLKSYKK